MTRESGTPAALLEPLAHQDVVDPFPADAVLRGPAAFDLEPETFVQRDGPLVRREHLQGGLSELAVPHPLQAPFHEGPPQADFPVPLADRDPEGADVALLRRPPGVDV